MNKASGKINKIHRVPDETMFDDSEYVHDQLDRLLYALEAFREGDVSVRLNKERNDKFADVAEAYNSMVDMIGGLTTEISRISRAGGIEGNLDIRVQPNRQVNGIWSDVVVNINTLIKSISQPVYKVNSLLTDMADGKMGGQISVPNVSGIWKQLIDNVNIMASNLTSHVRNIAKVASAVASGDLSKKVTMDVTGEFIELKNSVNQMVDFLSLIGSEVTNVSREIGLEGHLGRQAHVPGVEGSWKELIDNVNRMIGYYTSQVREIAQVTTAVVNGDLSHKMDEEEKNGELLELSHTINRMVDSLNIFASEVTRVSHEVGTKGELGGQARVPDVAGIWKDLTENVNGMAMNLTNQVREITNVAQAVARGNFSQKITVSVNGEMAVLKDTINDMVEGMTVFSAEVSRVAKEVGSEGLLGGQAVVPAAAGNWKELTDNVNSMAENLTNQVRAIALVAKAVAQGDLTQKITIDARGEMAGLKNTINGMVDTLNVFSDEVIKVARDVGVEGKLGGQAMVPAAAGSWKRLTENVNLMAVNLTSQVREIAMVSSALANGNFSRKIEGDSKGELLELKNNINSMVDSFINIVSVSNEIAKGNYEMEMPIRSEDDRLGKALYTMTNNLRRISIENENETWIKTGQSGLNDKMRGEQNITDLAKNIITYLTKYINGDVGVIYLAEEKNNETVLKLTGTYAYTFRNQLDKTFKLGESVVGQAALEKEPIVLSNIPDDEICISSGIAQKTPKTIVVHPLILDQELVGVIEIGSFELVTENHLNLLRLVSENVAIAINSAKDRQKMKSLLEESRKQSDELMEQQQKLKEQSDALKATNEELETKTMDLERQKEEVSTARSDIERKAKELEMANKYKSEFLANMSHELRTPLNSLLILSKELAKNEKGNLNDGQVKDAQIIYEGGTDLLNLINDILDLSKVEAGYMNVDIHKIEVNDITRTIVDQFTPLSKQKGLSFIIKKDENLPKYIATDQQRLEQILKNLLSNAFKFTNKGEVKMTIYVPERPLKIHGEMYQSHKIVAFSVKDTGIGIDESKQTMIFEAFQQGDGGISRRYGGTGLGLTISREMAALLGGEIRLKSELGKGSEFTFYMPQNEPMVGSVNTEIEDPSEEFSGNQQFISQQPLPEILIRQHQFMPDDRNEIIGKDHSILVIEDDRRFAEILQQEVHRYGIKTIVTDHGKDGLELASRYLPDGIILDLKLPDINGLNVLDHLKFNLETRHIPVHVFSVEDEEISTLRKGAIGFLAKPVSKKDIEEAIQKIENIHNAGLKNILIIEDNKNSQEAIVRLLENKEIRLTTSSTGKSALSKLKKQNFDCLILDLRLPDMSGFDVLKEIQETDKKTIPVIIYTGKELSKQEITELNKYTQSIIIKGAISPERLLDEVSLFIHSLNTNLSEEQRRIVAELHDPEQMLKGRKILIVDDDMRNTYALSKKLTDVGMDVLMAENGLIALEQLKENEDLDIIIMDIMMPVMDGLEAIRKIREQKKFKKLPIISLTAKAMAEDKKQCMNAGANDYLTKPVDMDQLINLLRVWLYEKK